MDPNTEISAFAAAIPILKPEFSRNHPGNLEGQRVRSSLSGRQGEDWAPSHREENLDLCPSDLGHRDRKSSGVDQERQGHGKGFTRGEPWDET